MDGFLQVNKSVTNLPSPTHSFMADEVASICPLITPSPPTNDLINPLPEPTESNYTIGEELATILQHVQNDDKCGEDSASSSSSASAEPACTQLLNHRNGNYHHITKDEHTATEETAGKVQTLQLTFRNPPDNYFFMSWNWPLIRKISLWMFLAALVAMVALVVAMIMSLPKTCNPETEWYQGKVLYEIFPASFNDSNGDMIGDFKGISLNADYIMELGVKGIRLNSIFKTPHYPEDYKNVTTLLEIDSQLGDMNDFRLLTKHFHSRNLTVLLDLPIFPVVKQLSSGKAAEVFNHTSQEPSMEFLKSAPEDPVEEALLYWINRGVDGFYLKGMEYFVDDPHLASSLRRWKKIIGPNRPFIVSDAFLSSVSSKINVILNNVDLIDIRLKVEDGVVEVSKQIEAIQNGTLFSRPGLPWIHWSIGDDSTNRLVNILPYGNGTLGAILLQLMLPGTPCIFYGNEISLPNIADSHGEWQDLQHLHHLTQMAWKGGKQSFSWLHSEKTLKNFDQIQVISKMARLRDESPAIYLNSVYKDKENKANAEVKYSTSDLLVIQRWYPRRKSYVIVSNLGNKIISADLSTLLYSGLVVIGPKTDSKSESISFKDISLSPGESVVIQLD